MKLETSIEGIKSELINDLISITTVMEEIWKYHPDNKEKFDIIEEYKDLQDIKANIEEELDNLDK